MVRALEGAVQDRRLTWLVGQPQLLSCIQINPLNLPCKASPGPRAGLQSRRTPCVVTPARCPRGQLPRTKAWLGRWLTRVQGGVASLRHAKSPHMSVSESHGEGGGDVSVQRAKLDVETGMGGPNRKESSHR